MTRVIMMRAVLLLLTAGTTLTAAFSCKPECQNGDCVAYLGELSCQCNGNWSGEACDQFVCDTANPCLNNGVCSVHPADSTKYLCSCPFGYTGNRCQHWIPNGIASNCTGNPCGNNGVCLESLETLEGYYCKCNDGYYGPSCNFTTNPCEREDCNGNGYCRVVPNRRGKAFPLCFCNGFYGSLGDPFPGAQCAWVERFNECHLTPCRNGGVCKLVDYPEAYSCTCPPAFRGKNCEIPFDVCSNETQRCLNGGACHPDGHYFTCSCPPNFAGERCEFIVDPCHDKPCQNGGQCVVSEPQQPNGYYLSNVTAHCKCQHGYSGEQCRTTPKPMGTVSGTGSHPLTRCTAGSPCRSPRSHTRKCIKDSDDSLFCICEDGWGGVRCDLDIDECFEKPCAEGERCTNTPGKYICSSVH